MSKDSPDSGSGVFQGAVLKAMVVVGGALLLKKLRKATTRRDHAAAVAQNLVGDRFSREQALRDPDNYFNMRMVTCPAAEMEEGSKLLYFEEAFWRTPNKPFRQRFYMVKPCRKEMKCDVELNSFAIRDIEEYKNFCDRPKDQRLQPEEVIGDIVDHLATIHISRCKRGKRCLYEGSSLSGGFPNSWNGATFGTSELTVHRNGEVHCWDRGYDDKGNQVWGPSSGPYEFKLVSPSSYDDVILPLNI